MIDRDDQFLDVNKDKNPFAPKKQQQRTGVIKSRRNHVQGTIHIDPETQDSGGDVEFFQPIYEGELIVGVVHKCSCGKTSELKFQYSAR